MKVAILSHFQSFAPSYALAVGWYERAAMLDYYGVDFDFLCAKNCPEGSFPHQKSVLATVPGSKPFKERVDIFTKQYLELLAPYDVILTCDLIYQRKGNFLAWNQAARNAAEYLKAWWCHWIHSSWTNRPNNLNMKDPDHLRFTMMDRSFLVYLNSAEVPSVAKMYGTDPGLVRTVHNPKDPRVFLGMHQFSWHIIKKLDLPNKRAVCIFPHCSTRMDAKGIDAVIRVMAALKRRKISIGLVLCNANARKVQSEIAEKKQYMEKLGLVENEDYMFTHELSGNYAPMPRQVIKDLMQISNIFVFGSWRETTGNAFQEAQITNNLLVLNQHLPCLQELARKDEMTVWLDTSYKTPGVRDGQTGDFKLVEYPEEEKWFNYFVDSKVIPVLPDKSYMWAFSFDRIWRDQFKPLLEDAADLSFKTVPEKMKTNVVVMTIPKDSIYLEDDMEAGQC